MALYPIDLLNIRDKELRNQHYKKLLKNADEHKMALLDAYMALAEKKPIVRVQEIYTVFKNFSTIFC